ncbi:MAG: hypothetical protein M3Y43_08275 [Pseudomonadota bacterium]|nr:hypothetical protein [Pseudomonadota bacterium]MDQ2705146.1 hypothetical protein [Pseudomonadota bacterium]
MSLENEKTNFFVSKLSGLILIVVGFVVAASGYRAESTPYLTGGIVLLAIGIALIVAKVIRRNPSA